MQTLPNKSDLADRRLLDLVRKNLFLGLTGLSYAVLPSVAQTVLQSSAVEALYPDLGRSVFHTTLMARTSRLSLNWHRSLPLHPLLHHPPRR